MNKPGRSFEDVVGQLRNFYDSPARKELQRQVCIHQARQRKFRQPGYESEGVTDLVDDLEYLFLCSGLKRERDDRKQQLRNAFSDWPSLCMAIDQMSSYDQAVQTALAWFDDPPPRHVGSHPTAKTRHSDSHPNNNNHQAPETAQPAQISGARPSLELQSFRSMSARDSYRSPGHDTFASQPAARAQAAPVPDNDNTILPGIDSHGAPYCAPQQRSQGDVALKLKPPTLAEYVEFTSGRRSSFEPPLRNQRYSMPNPVVEAGETDFRIASSPSGPDSIFLEPDLSTSLEISDSNKRPSTSSYVRPDAASLDKPVASNSATLTTWTSSGFNKLVRHSLQIERVTKPNTQGNRPVSLTTSIKSDRSRNSIGGLFRRIRGSSKLTNASGKKDEGRPAKARGKWPIESCND